MSAQTTLDELWVKDDSENRDFWGGLIQCAVSLYHLTSGNPKGAHKIYEKARLMIEPFGSYKNGIDLGQLKRRMDELFDDLDESYSEIDYLQRVPRIMFNGQD